MSNETLKRVIHCLSATTRYPTQLLNEDADIENDLGIDSVKRVEIVIALSEEFGIDLKAEQRDPTVRTIGDLSRWIDGRLEPGTEEQGDTKAIEREVPARNGNTNRDQGTQNDREKPRQAVRRPHHLGNGSSTETSSMVKSLSGRVALVTGSGRGIGRTIARVLAARGAAVVVNSFHSRDEGEKTAAEINAQGGTAIHIWGSVANQEHVENLFAQIKDQFGHLDILVCNASDGRIGPFLELTWEDWDRAFRTNVSGHYHCALGAAKLMRLRGGGAIVTMSAVGAHQFVDGLGSQGVAKAAVETLTRYLACELGQFGIRVNCVAGGPVYGELLSKFHQARASQDHWESITPDGELCSPMDLAQTIAFLVGEEARGINGVVWTVDHGFSANGGAQPLRRASLEMAQASSG